MFRLALALGCTLRELDDRMSYDEMIEWMEYYSIEPWGCEANDYRSETFFRMFWSANASKDSPAPERFIDWDPAWTAEIKREEDARKPKSLDEKIAAFFGPRAASS